MYTVYFINLGWFSQAYFNTYDDAKAYGINTGYQFAIYELDKVVYPSA